MNAETIPTELTATQVLPASSRTANANGTAVDLRAYDGKVAIVVDAGDITSGADDSTYTIALLTGDDTNISNASAATLNTSVGLTNVASLTVASVDTRLAGRYLFAQANITGASSPAFPCSAVAIGVLKYS